MNPVVASDKLKRGEVWAEDDESVHWAGAFAVYGGHGATASSTIVYEIEPGKRLGWHTDATEETQYIIAGTGELHMEDGSVHTVGPGSVFVLPTPVKHEKLRMLDTLHERASAIRGARFREATAVPEKPGGYGDRKEKTS
jgi:quercetin dioxygenase-like cupin family protein